MVLDLIDLGIVIPENHRSRIANFDSLLNPWAISEAKLYPSDIERTEYTLGNNALLLETISRILYNWETVFTPGEINPNANNTVSFENSSETNTLNLNNSIIVISITFITIPKLRGRKISFK